MSGDDQETFRALYLQHYQAVLGYLLRRSHRDHAADLAAEVFAVAWRKREHLPVAEYRLPWLYAVAARTLANHRRSMRRRAGLAVRARRLATGSDPGPEMQMVRRSEDEAVIAALQRLRPTDRETLLLSAWDGLSASQIAVRYEISLAAAEKRLTRAKKRLSAELGRHERHLDVTPRVAKEGGAR